MFGKATQSWCQWPTTAPRDINNNITQTHVVLVPAEAAKRLQRNVVEKKQKNVGAENHLTNKVWQEIPAVITYVDLAG